MTLLAVAAGIVVVLVAILKWRLPAFLALLVGAVVTGVLAPTDVPLGERLATGFGKTLGNIGLVIALAAVIGEAMRFSGAADRIVRATLAVTGERFATAAFASSGFLLGIPMFVHTANYLMAPVGKAFSARTGQNYLTTVLTVICGATMSHSLVPPTPGPLIVANELDVPVATMMSYGCVVGVVTVLFGYAYALVVGARYEVPLRDEEPAFPESGDEPSLVLSLLPILIPVGLIAAASWVEPARTDYFAGLVQTLGDQNIALLLATALSLLMLWRWNHSGRSFQEVVSGGITGGASVVLIVGAGGAFGLVLQESGIDQMIRELPLVGRTGMLTLAFLVTAVLRTSQGSGTVAMLTTAALFADVARSGALGCDAVYLALAIGCGSKVFGWMNDSGFWVISRSTGLTPEENLRFVSPMTSLMGIVGLGVTILLATFAP